MSKKPGGAFRGIKIEKVESPKPEKKTEKKLMDILDMQDQAGEVEKYAHIKKPHHLGNNAEEVAKVCDRAVKAFMRNDMSGFKENQTELLYLKSRQSVVYVDDAERPGIQRVIAQGGHRVES